jgi:hypothetical protein
MLIMLPSTPTTQQASLFLTAQGVVHQVIAVPASLQYQNASTVGIYTTDTAHGDLPMLLTKQRFVVMRVFKDYIDPTLSAG